MKIFDKVFKKFNGALNYKERNSIKNEFIASVKKSRNPKIYYFGVPAHVNLGDQAIAEASVAFFERYWENYEIFEIYSNNTGILINSVEKLITSEDIIVLHGGGNIGNLYLQEEINRRRVLKKFKNNKIISMPQSIFFSDDEEGKKELEISQKIYNENNNLILFSREELSYKKMKNYFPKNQIFLIPDIVTSLDKKKYSSKRNARAIVMLRNDIEASLDKSNKEKVTNSLSKFFSDIKFSDTRLKEQTYITKELRRIVLESKWREISRFDILVTDRLHGMIFGYITKTPTIAFDNSYKKVSESYFTFLKNCEYIEFIEGFSEEKFEEAIKKVINATDSEHDVLDKFDVLRQILDK